MMITLVDAFNSLNFAIPFFARHFVVLLACSSAKCYHKPFTTYKIYLNDTASCILAANKTLTVIYQVNWVYFIKYINCCFYRNH